MARRRGALGLVLTILIGTGSACSSTQTRGSITSSPSGSSTASPGATTPPVPSPPLATGTPVPGYRVGPLSFISPARGFALLEFDAKGSSTSQQLVETEDGGLTWKAETSTALPTWAGTLVFTDSENGYAWGGQGLDVTHDGGQHWAFSLTFGGNGGAVSPIGKNVWALTSSGVLESTTDGGNTWNRALHPPVSGVLLTRVTTSVAYVLGCGPSVEHCSEEFLARTEDGGVTWQTRSLPQEANGQGSADLVALSADDLWLVQFGQPATNMSSKWVYRSNDGGAHWTLMASIYLGNHGQGTGHIIATGNAGPLSVLASAPNRAWLAEDRGGVLFTSDGGLDWQPAYNDPYADAAGGPYASFLDVTHGWVAADGLWRTTDGVLWTEIAPPPTGTY